MAGNLTVVLRQCGVWVCASVCGWVQPSCVKALYLVLDAQANLTEEMRNDSS